MKKFAYSILFVLNCFSASAQWSTGGPSNISQVNDLFINGNKIYCATDGPQCQYSADNGVSWTPMTAVSPSPTYRLQSVAVKGSNIFVGTNGDYILKSTDNGNSWNPSNNGLSSVGGDVYDICVVGSSIFLATNFGVYKSIDDGANWTLMSNGISTTESYYCIFVNGNDIYTGATDKLYKSSDNGNSWTAFNSVLLSTVKSIAISNNTLFTISMSGSFVKSTDNGSTWSYVTGGLPNDVAEVLSIGNTVFVATNSNGVYRSIDNGNTWVTVNTGLPGGVSNIGALVASSSHIFLGGGVVWQRPLSELLLSVEEIDNKAEYMILPNPAIDGRFYIRNAKKTSVEVEVYDLSGKKILAFTSGKKEIEINMQNYAAGSYLYFIKNKEEILQSGKLIKQ